MKKFLLNIQATALFSTLFAAGGSFWFFIFGGLGIGLTAFILIFIIMAITILVKASELDE